MELLLKISEKYRKIFELFLHIFGGCFLLGFALCHNNFKLKLLLIFLIGLFLFSLLLTTAFIKKHEISVKEIKKSKEITTIEASYDDKTLFEFLYTLNDEEFYKVQKIIEGIKKIEENKNI